MCCALRHETGVLSFAPSRIPPRRPRHFLRLPRRSSRHRAHRRRRLRAARSTHGRRGRAGGRQLPHKALHHLQTSGGGHDARVLCFGYGIMSRSQCPWASRARLLVLRAPQQEQHRPWHASCSTTPPGSGPAQMPWPKNVAANGAHAWLSTVLYISMSSCSFAKASAARCTSLRVHMLLRATGTPIDAPGFEPCWTAPGEGPLHVWDVRLRATGILIKT